MGRSAWCRESGESRFGQAGRPPDLAADGVDRVLGALSDEPTATVRGVLSAVVSDSTADRRPLDRVLEDAGVGRLIAELRDRGLVPAGEAAQRVRLAVGTILAFAALSSGPGLSGRGERELLIAFVTAGLRATPAVSGGPGHRAR
ncbi:MULTISPECIES: hypothetical protein [unclassified Amycolatopsis]|uniref:hypothetical protein n=1 Tax=unclassified Amycolatopsis TaxID=2618356 RepID=UPI00287519A5|nr:MULTISPECIES: hypothetical protein [unclassified Amycolatopsis]MDS0135915.1 hypothetical protein [Amycolatopsis sp. 505]MDS0145496.1 hypothetical protein [Amycolatopsis sp. CM201R]